MAGGIESLVAQASQDHRTMLFGISKRPETRERRIAQAEAWMAEGKRRNWKYEKC